MRRADGATQRTTRDPHLAKRHYDMAAETAAEAAVPVALALCELYLLQLYDAYSGSKPGGGGGGGGGGAPLAGAAKRAAAARASLGDAMPEWDTLLILVLSAVLVLVLLARQMLGE